MNIKELGISIFKVALGVNLTISSTVKYMVNLEQLFLSNIEYEMIESFIQYLTNSKAIKVNCTEGNQFIDLSVLNKKT